MMPLRVYTPCTWNYYPCHLSSHRDDLRLFCLLAQALMPLGALLTGIYLIHLKNLIWADIVKCQVKYLSSVFYLIFLQKRLFQKIYASTGGPNKISRRAVCGPRAVGWTALS